jgi:urease accessory protein
VEALSLGETRRRDEPDGCETPAAAAPVLRGGGVLRLELKRRGDATVLDRLYQSGSLKARLFRPEPRHCAEAVLLNTSGGLVGGDRLFHDIRWGPATHAAVTTPA